MYWYYWKFTCHPVDVEKFEMRGRNNIISLIITGYIQILLKGVCSIFHIPCAFIACVAQLDKYWLPNCDRYSQPIYSIV